MLGRRVLFRTTTPCWPPVGTGTSGVAEKTQERTYKEVPRLHPGDPPHSTHIHTHVGADACYGSWWNIWIKIVPTSSLPGRGRLYFVTSYQLLMDNKICVWGIEFWANGDIGEGGVFKSTWELSLEMSVLRCVARWRSARERVLGLKLSKTSRVDPQRKTCYTVVLPREVTALSSRKRTLQPWTARMTCSDTQFTDTLFWKSSQIRAICNWRVSGLRHFFWYIGNQCSIFKETYSSAMNSTNDVFRHPVHIYLVLKI